MSHRLRSIVFLVLSSFGFSSHAGSPPPNPHATLIVLATESDAFLAVRRASALENLVRTPLMVLASESCKNLKPKLFLVVAKDSAFALQQAKQMVPDSYQRACQAKPHAPHLEGETAIDPSFARMKALPVNWGPEKMMARVVAAPAGGTARVLIRPYFNGLENDPQEGLRYAVQVLTSAVPRVELIADCIDAYVSLNGRHVAVACATEQVLEQSLYTTQVFELETASKIAVFKRCAEPRLVRSERQLVCAEQGVSSSGEIVLTQKTRSF